MRRSLAPASLVSMLAVVAALVVTGPASAQEGHTTLASTSQGGTKGDSDSHAPVLSSDGGTVAFQSSSTNLHPSDVDTIRDVYVKDVVTGDVVLASTSDLNLLKGNGDSFAASLSADGTRVAFQSMATTLDLLDLDDDLDVYVKNLVTGDIVLASTTDLGQFKGNADSFSPAISADGTRVAFVSAASNLDPADGDNSYDIYVKNLLTGDVALASRSDSGTKGNKPSTSPALSSNGTVVAFDSTSTNLDPGDADQTHDVYVKDLSDGDLTLVSRSDSGTKGNGTSLAPALSSSGGLVAFQSAATNLDPADADSTQDVYVKNVSTGNLTLASTSDAEAKGNGGSVLPYLSSDGSLVAFQSISTNLDPADTDITSDIYVEELATGDVTLASTSSGGVKGNGGSTSASMSTDGTVVAFDSAATNLAPADGDAVQDVYVKELGQPAIEADLNLTSVDGPDPLQVGSDVTSTITLRNQGPDDAQDVSMAHVLPVGLVILSMASTQGTCSLNGVTVTCEVGDMGATPVTITIVGSGTKKGTKAISTTVTSSTTDPDPSDNSVAGSTKFTGKSCTFIGTQEKDTIYATEGDDVICGLGKNDALWAYGGNDVLYGGEGGDNLRAGEGGDNSWGGNGEDFLISIDAESGNDTLNGGPGIDDCDADPEDKLKTCET
jgi:uncharacterized repeat protein (TIGR01451 family)